MLTIKNLSKNFGKKKVLANFSYTFDNGVYGLLGPNGAGKTTLIRCLTQIYSIKKDTVLYNGECITKDKNFLSRVGYLPQKFGLFKDLSVKDALLLLANLKNIDAKEARPMIEDCLSLVNLTDRINDRVSTLSGGMIRRLGIAQALLGNPDILIFDEPTAGLDPEERLRFKNIVSKIKKDKIIIISTHIVEDVEACCNAVVIMKGGTVGASGTCAEIAKIAEGKTYLVPQTEESSISGTYIVQKQLEDDQKPILKILADTHQEFKMTEPNVEDGYICVLKGML